MICYYIKICRQCINYICTKQRNYKVAAVSSAVCNNSTDYIRSLAATNSWSNNPNLQDIQVTTYSYTYCYVYYNYIYTTLTP